LVLGLVLFGTAYAARSGILDLGISYPDGRLERAEHQVASPNFPVTGDAARLACGMSVSVRECLDAERQAIDRGVPLWASASVDARRECLPRGPGIPGMAGSITACLVRKAG